MTMKRLFIVLILLTAGMTCLQAQSFEEYKKKREAEYNAYKNKKESDFEAYRSRVNAAFAEYMRKYWVWLDSKDPMTNPEDNVPDVKPVVLPDLGEYEIPEDNELSFDEIVPIPFDDPEPISVAPIEYKPKPAEKKVQFRFYGSLCSVRFDPAKKVVLAGCRENAVADMWGALSSDDYNNLLYDTQELRKSMKLCDWAYLKLTGAVAYAVYGKGTNEAVVLRAFLMNQSGFRIRMGRSGNDDLHLLIATADDMYNRTYWEMDGSRYYLAENVKVSGLYLFDTKFPNEQSLRLSVSKEQNFAKKNTPVRTLRAKRNKDLAVTSSVNENALSFYEDYPASYVRNNKFSQWYHFANAPISEDVKKQIYPYLKSAIAGKTQAQAANVLIDFVQTAFEYKTDDEAWGYERTFFPEETLYYPYCDCEDRAILFSRLVRDLLGLEVVLLYYPGHLATAVCFNEEVTGDYIMLSGKKYLVCDPTFIGATIGMTMVGMDNGQAKILYLS